MFGIDDAILYPAAASAFSSILGYSGQKDTNTGNRENAQVQREWEERMSSSSYQRQVADLKAAGLNPMLGYMKGSGASTPSGPSLPVYSSPRSAGLHSAREGYREASEGYKRREDTRSSKAEADVKETVAKGASKVSSGLDAVSQSVPVISEIVRSAVQGATDAAASVSSGAAAERLKALVSDPKLSDAVEAVRGRSGTTLDSVQKLLSKAVSSAGDVADKFKAPVDAPSVRSYRFKGNYETVMGQINRIKNPADRKAAKAQYMKQITR